MLIFERCDNGVIGWCGFLFLKGVEMGFCDVCKFLSIWIIVGS